MVYKKNEVRRIVLKYAKELQKRITIKKLSFSVLMLMAILQSQAI